MARCETAVSHGRPAPRAEGCSHQASLALALGMRGTVRRTTFGLSHGVGSPIVPRVRPLDAPHPFTGADGIPRKYGFPLPPTSPESPLALYSQCGYSRPMARVMTNMRLREDLRDWADAYAAQRGSSRTAVVEAALEHFAELAGTGVAELPVPREQAHGSRLGEARAPRTSGDGVRRPGPAPEAGAPAAGSRPSAADGVSSDGGRNGGDGGRNASDWARAAALREQRLKERRGR